MHAFSLKVAKYILLLVVACSFILNGREAIAATHISYSVRHYMDEDGLPENSVKSIRQDENGFIWLTTEDGLTRFDGNSFFIYNVENTAISSNRFIEIKNELYQDKLYAYNLNHEYVSITDGKAIADTAFSKFSYENVVRFFETNNIPVPPNVALEQHNYIVPLARHAFYLCTADELYFYRNNKLNAVFPVDSDAVVKYEIWRIFLAGQSLYYCTADGSIKTFENGKTRTIALTGDILENKDYQTHRDLLRVVSNTSGKSTLIFLKKCLYRLTQKANGDIETHLLIDDFDFDGNKIVSGYFDEGSESVFLGSNINGLYVFSKKRFQAISIERKDIGNNYYALAIHNDSTVISPRGNLIRKSGASENVFEMLPINYNQYTILKDQYGYTWLTNQGLCRLAPDFKMAGHWNLQGSIIALHEGKHDKIWIGTREGHIFYMDEKALGQPVQLKLVFVGISYLLQQDDDILWVAGRYGLYRVHLKTMQVDTIRGLNNQYVRSLYLDSASRLWITTYENGFYLSVHDSLTHFPLDDDHYLMAAHCIIEDKSGYFWITTNKGLFQVAKKDLLAYAAHQQQDVFYLYYNKNNGFNTNEFNGGCQPCGLIFDNGDISFPSLDGIVWFASHNFNEELPDKKIFIDKIELNNKSIPVSENINLQQHFDLLNISVSSPYFGDRRNVHMYFALVKDDEKPVYRNLPASGIISLQNLSSGKYALYIRKTNGFGKNNYTQKIIRITIAPYWFQTTWFFIGVGIILLLSVYLFIRMRTHFLLAKNRMLEILIRKRTLKLEQALNSLKASQDAQAKQTFIQERLIAAISHDIRTPLKYLSLFNKKIYEKLLQETTDETLLEMSKSAAESSNRMQHYLGNLLQYVKTSLQKGNIKSDTFNLYDVVKEHVDMLADVAASNKTTVINEVRRQQQLYTNRQLLGIILHNIIDNAVKVTIDGVIRITAEQKDNHVEIVVSDDGGGISAALQEWINNAFNPSAEAESDVAVNAGMGLFIVKELAILINARIHIVSDNSTCTEVHILLNRES